jgi:hypothetical protein
MLYMDVGSVSRVQGGKGLKAFETEILEDVSGSKKRKATETDENYVTESFTISAFQ